MIDPKGDPYCAYYATMIVESYLKFRNIFDAIEESSDIKYITRKLYEYDTMLNKNRK